MRSKNRKRIGPLPITLVAVFALAALLSVGLMLTINAGNVTQAQGLPDTSESAPDGEGCEVVVQDAAGDQPEAVIANGGCIVSGDSVDVMFKNEHDAIEQSIAVYVTGGDDFPGLQASDVDGTTFKVTNLGAVGIDERLLTLDTLGFGFGDVSEPGIETITVNRDMAKNGEVYLFVYAALTMTKAFPVTDLGIPLSVFTDDDLRSASQETAVLNLAEEAATVEVAIVDDAVASLLPDTVTTEEFTALPSLVVAAAIPDSTEDEQRTVKNIEDYLKSVKALDAYDDDANTALRNAVGALEVAVMRAQAGIDAINDGDPGYFLNGTADIAVKVNFRDVAAAAKLVDGQYDPEDPKGTPGSTIFVGKPEGTATEPDEKTESESLSGSSVAANVSVVIRDGNGVPLPGFVDLSVDTTASGAAKAVFEGSNRSSHYVKLDDDGGVTARITGLPKNEALRIPVTVNFNNGELEMMASIMRIGDAAMVEAAAYVCMADADDGTEDHDSDADTPEVVTDNTICDSEIAALGTSPTSDDPEMVMALGPEARFFISGSATDALGNNVDKGDDLSWRITPGTDNESDAKKAIDPDRGTTDQAIAIASGVDAIAGTYSLTVASRDGEASMMIMIVVSAKASMISVTCDPEMIPTDTGETTCTVIVTDAGGNIPSNLNMDGNIDTVRVTVRSQDVQSIDTGDPTTNNAELDDEGMATFYILLEQDATEGASITVNVSSTIDGEMLRDNTTVVYGGDAPTSMLTAPTGVMATSDAAGTVTVTWMNGTDALGHLVLLFNADFSGEPMVNTTTGSSAEFTGVAAGDYVAVVVSYRSASETEYAIGTVTVN